jgi:transposase-like protein
VTYFTPAIPGTRVTASTQLTAPCPHCKSSHTVRIGMIVGKWLHFCFDCGKRFEEKEEKV